MGTGGGRTGGDIRSRGGRRALLLGLLLALVSGVLAHRLWVAHAHDWEPLPGDVSAAGPCTVWFVGSSSFGYWTGLESDMRPWQAINRGVSGADIPRLLARWKRQQRFAPPRAIIVYAGENDIDRGRSADRVADEYAALLRSLSTAMPRVPILAMAIKPSPKRWSERDEQLSVNSKIHGLTEKIPSLHYFDANGGLMSDGVFGSYYWDDGIHLNEDGHRMWAERIKGELGRDVLGGGRPCGA
jgi:lysophospholipase L1-like esterase